MGLPHHAQSSPRRRSDLALRLYARCPLPSLVDMAASCISARRRQVHRTAAQRCCGLTRPSALGCGDLLSDAAVLNGLVGVRFDQWEQLESNQPWNDLQSPLAPCLFYSLVPASSRRAAVSVRWTARCCLLGVRGQTKSRRRLCVPAWFFRQLTCQRDNINTSCVGGNLWLRRVCCGSEPG